MKTRAILIIAILSAISATSSAAQQKRSEAAKNAFKHANPCPSNGRNYGACPGYVIDHIIALACGGADDPSNMQWQTVTAGRAKDEWERKGCKSSPTPTTFNRRYSSRPKPGYYLGPKGGCFTYSAYGKKKYVEQAYCSR
ncbi:HNH endonuclease signature motif containing protein [Methylomonas sp. 2BW1-5-20]|uniref:HNH endonuclease signature motif containing protein n=1 Tax=Methylomonas sp. 2BW1-5-20 TaxID=3376686 RepID=UPI00404EB0F7